MSLTRRAYATDPQASTYAQPEEGPLAVLSQTATEKDDGGWFDRELPAPWLADPPPSDPIKPLTTDEDTSMVPAYLGVPASTTPNVSDNDTTRDDAALAQQTPLAVGSI